jgi:hypothetical protein
MDWTEQKDNALKEGVKNGLSASKIAQKLGKGVTRNAVLGRIFRLKLVADGIKERKPYKKRRKSRTSIRVEDVIDQIMDLRDMGMQWWKIGETVGVTMQTARNWAIAHGGYIEHSVRKRFTPEDEAYIAKAYAEHVTIEEIADTLSTLGVNRTFGVIRQKVLQLQRKGAIGAGVRNQAMTRLLRRYGVKALEMGGTPSEALHKIAEAKRSAFANALHEAQKAKTVFKQQAMEEMMADIAAGVERNEAIFKARAKGVTLNEISECFNITRERVRQICTKQAELIALQKLLGEE